MAEEAQKKERTVQDIQQEYTQLCAKLGHLAYSKHTIEKDIGLVNQTLMDLNIEAAQVSAKAQKEAEMKKKIEDDLKAQQESAKEV